MPTEKKSYDEFWFLINIALLLNYFQNNPLALSHHLLPDLRLYFRKIELTTSLRILRVKTPFEKNNKITPSYIQFTIPKYPTEKYINLMQENNLLNLANEKVKETLNKIN